MVKGIDVMMAQGRSLGFMNRIDVIDTMTSYSRMC